MGLLSIDIQCSECGEITDIIVESEKRNEQQTCPLCDGLAMRTFAHIQTRTEKTSVTYVDGTTNRFDRIRLNEKLKRAKKEAKRDHDFKLEKEIKRDIDRHSK